jgi:hypothetical protein
VSRQFWLRAVIQRLLDRKPAEFAASSDRRAAGISIAEIAETDAFNATSYRDWREQALGLREFYLQLKAVTNPPQDP